MNNNLRKLLTGMQWITTRKGMACSNIWEAGGLIFGNEKVKYPNLQYHFAPAGFDFINGDLKIRKGFVIHIDLLRPKSSGYLKLNKNNLFGKPDIIFNYMSNKDDFNQMSEGIDKARDLINQKSFDEYRGDEITGISEGIDKNNKDEVIRGLTETDYHPCGTCKMGNTEDSVVDEELRVYGIDNLRIVDGSILPKIISANLNAPIQMIAHRASDFILNKKQLDPIAAKFSFN